MAPLGAQDTGARTLTVIRLIGDPAVLGILVDIVRVALGTLLGPEVLVGPRTVLAVADLVFERGSQARAASVGWAGLAQRDRVTGLAGKAGGWAGSTSS